MKEIEMEGKTVTMAVEKGLAELGLRRDQVEVQVLQEATPGFLGMGTKLARVHIREKIWGEEHHKEGDSKTSPKPTRTPSDYAHSRPSPERSTGHPPGRQHRVRESQRPVSTASRSQHPSPVIHQPPADLTQACNQAKSLTEEILGLMHIATPQLNASWDTEQMRVKVDIETSDAQILTSQDGRGLESLQFIITLILSRKIQTPVAVQVDTSGYWKEKEENVIRQVHQAMEMVKRTSSPVRLKPMDACLRRLVHRTLANHPEIETASEGEGSWRKVVLKPKKK